MAVHTCTTAIPVERRGKKDRHRGRERGREIGIINIALQSVVSRLHCTDCIVQTIRAGVSEVERRRDRHSEPETKLGPAARAVRQVGRQLPGISANASAITAPLVLRTAGIPHRDSLLHSAFSTLRPTLLVRSCKQVSLRACRAEVTARRRALFPK